MASETKIDLFALAQNALRPYYEGNHNTGNQYEIVFILYLLRKMGLTNTDIDGLAPYLAVVRRFNPKFVEEWITYLKSLPVGTDFMLEGSRVVNLRNVTQDDKDGGTGDVIAVLENGQERSISVEKGTVKKDGSISKCLSNPSCKRFGCSDAMITEFKRVAAVAVDEFMAEMSSGFGEDKDKWPTRTKTAAQNKCINYIATKTCAHFNGLDSGKKTAIIEDLLRVKDGSKPADYLGLVSENLKNMSIWSFGELIINPSDYDLLVRGDDLKVCHRISGDIIGSTQVKFNNGVYKKDKNDGIWKTSSVTSSWNGTFTLTKVFRMTRV
jgi:hypothetical protein